MTIFDDKSGQNEDSFEDILENSDLNEDPEIEANTNYPNEAYADLMTLARSCNVLPYLQVIYVELPLSFLFNLKK